MATSSTNMITNITRIQDHEDHSNSITKTATTGTSSIKMITKITRTQDDETDDEEADDLGRPDGEVFGTDKWSPIDHQMSTSITKTGTTGTSSIKMITKITTT